MLSDKPRIKDVFVGSLDAKDDVNNAISEEEFIKCFLVPPNFDLDEIISGNKFYIEGYKGTGKTALIRYLCKNLGSESFYKFLLFKSDYKNLERDVLNQLTNNLLNIDEKMQSESDFEYIWQWIILSKLVELNTDSNYKIFEKNRNWNRFEKAIRSLSKDSNSRNLFDILPFEVTKIGSVGYEVTVPTSLKQTLEINDIEFRSKPVKISFKSLLDKSMRLFGNLTYTGACAYIFIDELEAFFDDINIFKRDLRMIRDLILTVKFLNEKFIDNGFSKVKIVCAVRTEILESIKKYIVPKEINKCIYSFKKELKWNYNNTVALQHPIIQIWLKRIKIAEAKFGINDITDAEVKAKWFTEKIGQDDIIPYILDNTWNKPRDIVRFLQSATNVSPNSTMYSTDVFNSLRKEYSKESWKEVYEELNSAYTPQQIDRIKEFFVCYKKYFYFEEAKVRAKNLCREWNDYFLSDNLLSIFKNLYRVGFIGNLSVDRRYYRWQHKGDDDLVVDDSKLYVVVHNALWNELSLFFVYGEALKEISIGSIVACRVKSLNRHFAYVDILDSNFLGSIHIKYISKVRKFVEDINNEVKIGDVLQAEVIGYDEKFGYKLKRI